MPMKVLLRQKSLHSKMKVQIYLSVLHAMLHSGQHHTLSARNIGLLRGFMCLGTDPAGDVEDAVGLCAMRQDHLTGAYYV